MSLRFVRIKRRPMSFERLFWVKVEGFERIVDCLRPLWEKQIIAAYQRPGRAFKLALENQVLMVLLYYRSYSTQFFMGSPLWPG